MSAPIRGSFRLLETIVLRSRSPDVRNNTDGSIVTDLAGRNSSCSTHPIRSDTFHRLGAKGFGIGFGLLIPGQTLRLGKHRWRWGEWGHPALRVYEECAGANGCAGGAFPGGKRRVFPRSLIGQIQRIGSARHGILNEDEVWGAGGG